MRQNRQFRQDRRIRKSLSSPLHPVENNNRGSGNIRAVGWTLLSDRNGQECPSYTA
jgi:hypothetical protein